MFKLNQNNIKQEDKSLAISVKNYIKGGSFVIGNPALGLKQSLAKLEEQRDKEVADTEWALVDKQLEQNIKLTKAGIIGEERLSNYLAKLLKLDPVLEGTIAFASLSYGDKTQDLDYTPDTDIILVYGKHILIIDAKNIKAKGDVFQIGHTLVNEKGKEIISFNSSIPVWRKIFNEAEIEIDSITGIVCIVNDVNTPVVKDENWKQSDVKTFHASELRDYLHNWVQGKDNTAYLQILTEISKAQIKDEQEIDLDITRIKKTFGI